MLPVFALEYAGCDQGRVSEGNASTTTTTTTNPSSHVSLLATLPMVASGAASFLLVPLSIAVGRRPVLLLCGLAAWAGGFWAGSSRGLGGHLAARCLQGLGSGVVDALVPLIVQDMTFIHQRGNVLAAMGAAMTVVTVCLNIARSVWFLPDRRCFTCLLTLLVAPMLSKLTAGGFSTVPFRRRQPVPGSFSSCSSPRHDSIDRKKN